MPDPSLLDTSEVELVDIKVLEEEPIVVVQFTCQQVRGLCGCWVWGCGGGCRWRSGGAGAVCVPAGRAATRAALLVGHGRPNSQAASSIQRGLQGWHASL